MSDDAHDLREEGGVERPLPEPAGPPAPGGGEEPRQGACDERAPRRRSPLEEAAGVPLLRLRRIGPYRILRVLGRGGMGIVYQARHSELKRKVALKVISKRVASSPEAVERFRLEARSAASLSHPNIVPIYEVGEEEGRPYIAMEYIRGRTLKELVVSGDMDHDLAAHLTQHIALALEYAHSRNIVHRDLKPGNILVDRMGTPYLTDFGLAKRVEEDAEQLRKLTRTGRVLGTPAFMSPEQARGEEVDGTSDIFALGSVLYYALTGKLPFEAEGGVNILYRVIHDEPLPVRQHDPSVPRELAAICAKAMAKKKGWRYASGREVGRDIERYFRGREVAARTVGVFGRLADAFAASKMRWGIVLSLLVAASAYVVFVLVDERNRRLTLTDPQVHFDSSVEHLGKGEHGKAVMQLHLYLLYRPFGPRQRRIAQRLTRALRTRMEVLFQEGKRAYAHRDYLQAVDQFGRVEATHRLLSEVRGLLGVAPVMATDRSLRIARVLPGHRQRVTSLAAGPDGLLASASWDAKVMIWKVSTGKRTALLEEPERPVNALAASKRLLASGDDAGAVHLWSWDGTHRGSMRGGPERILALAFSPDGRSLAVAGTDQEIAVLDVQKKKRVRTLKGDLSMTLSLAWSPDGAWLASGGAQGQIRVFSSRRDETVVLTGHQDWVNSLAFSRDGRVLYSAGWDRTIRRWRLDRDPGPVGRIDVEGYVNALTLAGARYDRLVSLSWVSGLRLHPLDLTGERRVEAPGGAFGWAAAAARDGWVAVSGWGRSIVVYAAKGAR